ncbi:hypothetical protein BDZ89DRAFT_1052493 [Hymenopellis radicata]|nr:hypothetical protein BDZ89DRAFT_1052493 [Hymenopellis radicata]
MDPQRWPGIIHTSARVPGESVHIQLGAAAQYIDPRLGLFERKKWNTISGNEEIGARLELSFSEILYPHRRVNSHFGGKQDKEPVDEKPATSYKKNSNGDWRPIHLRTTKKTCNHKEDDEEEDTLLASRKRCSRRVLDIRRRGKGASSFHLTKDFGADSVLVKEMNPRRRGKLTLRTSLEMAADSGSHEDKEPRNEPDGVLERYRVKRRQVNWDFEVGQEIFQPIEGGPASY